MAWPSTPRGGRQVRRLPPPHPDEIVLGGSGSDRHRGRFPPRASQAEARSRPSHCSNTADIAAIVVQPLTSGRGPGAIPWRSDNIEGGTTSGAEPGPSHCG